MEEIHEGPRDVILSQGREGLQGFGERLGALRAMADQGLLHVSDWYGVVLETW